MVDSPPPAVAPPRGAALMGAARLAVGLALAAAPGAALRLTPREPPTPASVLLMRTIGIRDIVIGAGTVGAALWGTRDDARRWLTAGLASDSLDLAAGLHSGRSLGALECAVAVGSAATFVGLDLRALWSLAGGGRG